MQQPHIPTFTCFPDSNLHGEVEQIGVTVAHAVLVQKGRHNLATGRLKRDAECLVLDVGTQAAGVDLDGRLRTKTQAAAVGTHDLCELRFPSYYPEPHANHFNTGVKGEL
jgi:hypothetical protein